MSKARIAAVATMIAAACCFPGLAHAQATRTWVSGVGDDANPCSRTAPCKTFPGAISKTAAGGEIDTLDPGGFGGVTITKSITIDGNLRPGRRARFGNKRHRRECFELRLSRSSCNLDINGIGSGLAGILILGAGHVRIEHGNI